MSTISKLLSGIMYNGSALALGTAPFKSNLNAISGFNAAGTGYTSYRPSNAFNSLTQLAQDGVYIVDAKTAGFDIPGAVLTAVASVTTHPLSLSLFQVQRQGLVPGSTTKQAIELNFALESDDASDEFADILFYSKSDYIFSFQEDSRIGVSNGSSSSRTITGNTGTKVNVIFVTNTGNTLVKEITF